MRFKLSATAINSPIIPSHFLTNPINVNFSCCVLLDFNNCDFNFCISFDNNLPFSYKFINFECSSPRKLRSNTLFINMSRSAL